MQLIILGGGFCGAALALHLARHASGQAITRLTVVEPAATLGVGTAYSTPFASHLLNVRHMNMGLHDDDREHFTRWLTAQRRDLPSEYAERRLYGRYLQECLRDRFGSPGSVFQHVRARAVDIEPPPAPGAPARVHLDTGEPLEGHQVALCLGSPNVLPGSVAHLVGPGPPLAVLDPWRWEQLAALPAAGQVFILGTGLTMVDTVLTLQERGFAGTITAMSRHGLAPQPHLAHTQPQPPPALPTPLTVAGLVRAVRAAARAGGPWQPLLDSLRAQTPALWQALSAAERQRFLRLVKPYWNVHRHRIAPEVHARLQALRAAGKLVLCAGRLIHAQRQGDAFALQVRRRGGGMVEHRADCLVSCAGLNTDWRAPRDPLLQALLRRGLVQADALGMGMVANPAGQALDAQGRAVPWLTALGSALIGRDLESTAVPELRQQAGQVAARWLGLSTPS